jgi:arylsulfatase A-like enzyme
MPGQYGGMIGSVYDPFLIEGDPNRDDYDPLALKLDRGMTVERMSERLSLLQQVDHMRRQLEQDVARRYDRLQDSAYHLVMDGRVRDALDLSRESAANRDRYGRNKFGQSLLVARRLIEAGVKFIGYNDFNQKWDTHGQLAPRYRHIVPELDQGFSTLIEDLDARGMLDNTIVVLAGEFGRTPRINDLAGRDHWPNAYSNVVAGGKFQRGCVYGQSDAHGAEVLEGRVAPADLLATIWSQLGVAPDTIFRDRLDRPHMISSGQVITELLTG